ncbi:hypothetical protein M8C21_018468, partial [Ambrosia artemisiifolia]
ELQRRERESERKTEGSTVRSDHHSGACTTYSPRISDGRRHDVHKTKAVMVQPDPRLDNHGQLIRWFDVEAEVSIASYQALKRREVQGVIHTMTLTPAQPRNI